MRNGWCKATRVQDDGGRPGKIKSAWSCQNAARSQQWDARWQITQIRETQESRSWREKVFSQPLSLAPRPLCTSQDVFNEFTSSQNEELYETLLCACFSEYKMLVHVLILSWQMELSWGKIYQLYANQLGVRKQTNEQTPKQNNFLLSWRKEQVAHSWTGGGSDHWLAIETLQRHLMI